jgi:hypothetical protein
VEVVVEVEAAVVAVVEGMEAEERRGGGRRSKISRNQSLAIGTPPRLITTSVLLLLKKFIMLNSFLCK